MLAIGLSFIKLSKPPDEVPGLVVALLNNLPFKKPPKLAIPCPLFKLDKKVPEPKPAPPAALIT